MKLQYKIITILLLTIIFFLRYNYLINQKIQFQNDFGGVVFDVKNYENYNVLTIRNKHNVIVNTKEKFDIGDIVKISGEFEFIKEETIPNLFDISKNYKSKKTYIKYKNPNIMKIDKSKNIIYTIKNKLYKTINNKEYKDYYHLIIFGKTTYIENNVLNMIKDLNLFFIFSISGFQIITLLNLFEKLKVKKYGIWFIYIYLILLDYSYPYVRALLTRQLKLKSFFSNVLLTLVLLVIWPLYIFQPGFWFSTVIGLGIKLNKSKIHKRLYIYLLSLPIILYYNFEITLFSYISFLFQYAYIYLFVPFVAIGLFTNLFDIIFKYFIYIFELVLNIISKLNIKFVIFKPTIVELIFMYIVIYYLFKLINNKEFKKTVTLSLFILMLIFVRKNIPYKRVVFLDVDQGDSTVILYNRTTYVIDTGGKVFLEDYYAKEKLHPYLKSLGYSKINYLFITHGDLDHIGGAKYLKENNIAKNVILNNNSNTKYEDELLKYNGVKKLERFSYQNKTLTIKSINKLINDDENDSSLVLLINFDNYKILLPGDISSKIENNLNKNLIKNLNILKAAHHGSKYSNSKDFLKVTNPNVIINSHGCNNIYNHPHKEFINRIDKKTEIYSTCQNGTITVIMNKTFKIKTIK